MKRISFLLFITLLSLTADSQTVDTVRIFSKAMKKEFKCVVIRPLVAQDRPEKLPVVYLLHGYGGDYGNWIKRVPELVKYATQFQVMIVCPDGGISSWYFDSPVDSSMRYETFVAREVTDYIDKNYPTIKDRKGRAITGLSMGGHGGLFLGFRNPDLFGACGSMSGGVDLDFSRNKFDVAKRIGDTIKYAENWKKYSVIHMVENYPKDSLKIIFDCGVDDFFFKNNRALHEKMVKLKIPHEYIERPGAHNWAYWGNAVKYQLYFFRNYFDGK
jgi:S-formylglutathione hydrolase FrmB